MAQAPQPSVVVFSLFRYKTGGRAFVTSTAITEEEHLHMHIQQKTHISSRRKLFLVCFGFLQSYSQYCAAFSTVVRSEKREKCILFSAPCAEVQQYIFLLQGSLAAAAAAAAAACTTQAGVAGSMELSRLVKCRLVESEAHYIHNLNNTFLLQRVKNLCGECIRLHGLTNLNPQPHNSQPRKPKRFVQ